MNSCDKYATTQGKQMSKNIIKTLQGKSLDMEELALRNEKTRAVGNMNVNAAGDEIDPSNNTVATKTRRTSKNYRRQISKRVQDAPVMNSLKAARNLAKQYIEKEVDVIDGIDTITQVAKAPEPIAEPAKPAPKATPVTRPPSAFVKTEPAPVKTDDVSEELLQQVISKSTGGLAGAIAKAREVKQEPMKTPREEQRSQTGVKKI